MRTTARFTHQLLCSLCLVAGPIGCAGDPPAADPDAGPADDHMVPATDAAAEIASTMAQLKGRLTQLENKGRP